jgi:hypothetical protein
MIVELTGVAKGHALPPTSLGFESGVASLVIAETEQRPTVLGLMASGRMRPSEGAVTIDGAVDPRELQRRVALVDAPDANEPHADVTVSAVVAEELVFAGLPAGPRGVRAALDELGAADYAGHAIGSIPPELRLRLLCELALARKGVAGLVIVSPDRHGGDPILWWELARELADRGIAVLVIAGTAAAQALGTDDDEDEDAL